MQKPGLFAAFFGVVALALLPSCQDEDFGFTTDEIRQEVYNRNFKEIFGDVDPDHNWSMAQNVKVNINVPGARGYQVRVLTEAPTNREAIVLYQGTMVNDQLTTNVDVVRGSHYLFVEIKSGISTYLVDGYYPIDLDGNVEINKMVATRASGSAPSCSVYTTTLNRWSRTWEDTKEAPQDAYYTYDYGFKKNSRIDFLASGDINNITRGWCINCDPMTEDGERRYKDGGYNGGPRVLQMTNSNVEGLDNLEIKKSFYFRNLSAGNGHNDFNDAYVCFGEDPNYPMHIGDGDITIHIPLASRHSGELRFKLTLDRRNGSNWDNVKTVNDISLETKYATSTETEDNVLFKDVTLDFNAGWAGGDFRLKVQILTTGWQQAFCAGYIIEQKGNTPAFSEQVTDGTVVYRDVRGGTVYPYENNQLFNGETVRNWGNYKFHYRTYDTRKMTYSNGKDGKAGGYMGKFYIIDGDDGEAIKDGHENIKYRDMFPLYGLYKSTINNQWKGSPFREGDNHIDRYFKDGDYNTQVDYDMQPDAQIITWGKMTDVNGVEHDGSVSIKLVGIGTDWNNDVGYFYYPKSEIDQLMVTHNNGEKALDFNKIPKIIIRRNMQNAMIGDIPNPGDIADDGSSIHHWGFSAGQFNRFVDGCTALSMTQSEFDELHASGKFDKYDNPDDWFGEKAMIDGLWDNSVKRAVAVDATFEAPIYKLPFYGWQGNGDGKYLPTGTPTNEWPEDFVIGFFGIRTDDHTASELSRIYTSSASVQRNYFNDLPRGSAFTYKGKNYIGLEDEWDYDNNDFLFEVQGVKPVNPDITPHDDPVPDLKTSQDWIIACEDLGGVFDYDFNDLVWAITKEMNTDMEGNSTTDLYFTALAAGGTLEAIVEYNTSLALDPSDSGWDNNKWEVIGEIHNLVKRTVRKDGSYPTDVHTQLNVELGKPKLTLNDIGERIKLGETITSSRGDLDNINIASILNHFRIKVVGGNGIYTVVNRQQYDSHNHHDQHNSQDFSNNQTNTPQFILLPQGWAWPSETTCINSVYNISDWFSDAENSTWYSTWRNRWKGVFNFIENPLDNH